MVQFFKPQRNAPSSAVLTLNIERLDDQGRGVARHQGKVVFVAGALPGEQVEARLSRDATRYAEARLGKVVRASSERQTPICPHVGRCGGCRLQHASPGLQQQSKAEQLVHQLRQLGGLSVPEPEAVIAAAPYGYRRRARLALRIERGQLQLGFRGAASNDICAIDQCPVLEPALAVLLPQIRAALAAQARPDDYGHAELLLSSEGPLLLLRRLRPVPAPRLAALAAALDGLRFGFEDNDGSVVDVAGQPLADCHYQIQVAQRPLAIAFQPHHFIQVNAAVNQALVQRLLDWLQPAAGERLLDLFCGVGNFALPLAAAGAEVVAVEGVTAMVEQARANAERLGLSAQFLLGDLNAGVPPEALAGGAFSAVVLDPSREGAKGVVGGLAALGARRVAYISCNPATLARDAAVLAAQGFVLSRLALVDMFPQTHHVEALALFERR